MSLQKRYFKIKCVHFSEWTNSSFELNDIAFCFDHCPDDYYSSSEILASIKYQRIVIRYHKDFIYFVNEGNAKTFNLIKESNSERWVKIWKKNMISSLN